MASPEPAPTRRTAPRVAVGSERTSADETGELRVTTELPPSERAVKASSGRSARGRARPEARGRDGRPRREPLFAPKQRPGRRVVRIVRHVQLWSVFKVAVLGGLVLYVIFLVATGIAWSVANATGQVHHVEQFMRQIGFDNWSFNGPQLFRAAALLGAVLLSAGSVLITLWAAIVNLIAEATGGIRFTVIETEETDDDDDDLDDRDDIG